MRTPSLRKFHRYPTSREFAVHRTSSAQKKSTCLHFQLELLFIISRSSHNFTSVQKTTPPGNKIPQKYYSHNSEHSHYRNDVPSVQICRRGSSSFLFRRSINQCCISHDHANQTLHCSSYENDYTHDGSSILLLSP